MHPPFEVETIIKRILAIQCIPRDRRVAALKMLEDCCQRDTPRLRTDAAPCRCGQCVGLCPRSAPAVKSNVPGSFPLAACVPIAIGQSNWTVELDLEELFFHVRAKGNEIGHIGQTNWPVELDLEELFFHLRAKGN